MKSLILAATAFCLLSAETGSAQTLTPEITSWLMNPGGETGYDNIATNVQQVQYSDQNVYVSCTCIPGYDIGPWAGNPNVPANQNFVFKITRHPQKNTGTPVVTPLGHIGTWINGVSIFNAKDAMSYQNKNIWHQDALVFEGSSFDECLGHPAPNGEYHHHVTPTCLYDDLDSSQHSPVIGFAFDGFPIYGAWGFANADGTGGIRRMIPGYRKRNITQRTTLPDGTALAADKFGPAVSNDFPLGSYIEDYAFDAGFGDLDEHNGRFCVTPEYPAGIYAYFVTIDASGDPVYPYTLGPTYYGTVPAGNTGPQSGHNVPAEPVTTYVIVTSTGEPGAAEIGMFPNPASDRLVVECDKSLVFRVFDLFGRQVATGRTNSPLDLSGWQRGLYLVSFDENYRISPVSFVKE